MHYSDFEDHLIRRHYHQGAAAVAAMLGRSVKSIYRRAAKLQAPGNWRNKGRKPGVGR